MRSDQRPFTPEEDAALTAGLAAGTSYRAMAAGLGRSRSGVMARAAALARRPKRRLPPKGAARHAKHWTEAERDYLRAWWGLKPKAAVAAHLGRTANACEQRLWEMGVPWRGNLTPLAAVARVFGVSWRTAQGWVAAGLLVGRRTYRQGAGRLWHFPDAALRRFVRDHPERYDAARMQPGHWLTACAREAWAPPGAEAWVSTAEAGAAVRYDPSVIRRLVAVGAVPVIRRVPQRGGLLVRVGDVQAALAARPPSRRGSGLWSRQAATA